jgi:hypothetical protein
MNNLLKVKQKLGRRRTFEDTRGLKSRRNKSLAKV